MVRGWRVCRSMVCECGLESRIIPVGMFMNTLTRWTAQWLAIFKEMHGE